MNRTNFERWLESYGRAWEDGDPDAVTQLFTENSLYFETPFDPPLSGPGDIRRYWTEGAKLGQEDVRFRAEPLFSVRDTWYARWNASFRRVPSGAFVRLDGILACSFDDTGLCSEFREWWHRAEE